MDENTLDKLYYENKEEDPAKDEHLKEELYNGQPMSKTKIKELKRLYSHPKRCKAQVSDSKRKMKQQIEKESKKKNRKK